MLLHIRVCARARACVRWCPGAWTFARSCARVALLIKHEKRRRHIVLSFVASVAPPDFSTLSHKRHVTEHKISVFTFSTTFIENTFHSKKNSARYCHKLENILDRFAEKKSNFIKIRPVRTELFHVDERTDMTKQTVAFRNFANARKNWVKGKSG